MKFQPWPKRDPNKNYFKVPNEVFHIGLSYTSTFLMMERRL